VQQSSTRGAELWSVGTFTPEHLGQIAGIKRLGSRLARST
jgi:hypothetical protein